MSFMIRGDVTNFMKVRPVMLDPPGPANGYHASHTRLLAGSFLRLLGRPLLDRQGTDAELAQALFYAPFVLVSHDTSADPLFNYANQRALQVFEMSWQDFIGMPSRKSAEPDHRQERQSLLRRVAAQGFAEDYRGIRISGRGRRFLVEGAVVWNLFGERGDFLGQAATFSDCRDLER
jgi:hypothetical protein